MCSLEFRGPGGLVVHSYLKVNRREVGGPAYFTLASRKMVVLVNNNLSTNVNGNQ